MGSHIVQRGLASFLIFQIESLCEMGEAFFDPGAEREDRCMGKLVGRGEAGEFGSGICKRSQEKRSALEGGGAGIGQVRGLRFFPGIPEPIGDQRNDSFSFVSICLSCDSVA